MVRQPVPNDDASERFRDALLRAAADGKLRRNAPSQGRGAGKNVDGIPPACNVADPARNLAIGCNYDEH